MDPNRNWFNEQRLQRTIDALAKHGFHATWVSTAREACRRVLEMIPEGAEVGIGGSVTVRQIGLLDDLAGRGHCIVEHWKPNLSREEQLAIRRAQMNAEVFLASSNAVTEEGELVNIDGAGNRVNAMIFGPGKVIVIAGVNKIVSNVTAGIWRVKHVAAPMNAKRMGLKTPCGATGVCNESDSPARQCRVITIIERRPALTDLNVVLVNEELGF